MIDIIKIIKICMQYANEASIFFYFVSCFFVLFVTCKLGQLEHVRQLERNWFRYQFLKLKKKKKKKKKRIRTKEISVVHT